MTISGPGTPVDTPDGFPLVRADGVGLVAQEHGGALRVGNPGNVGGGRAAAERRRARAERDEAIDDAVAGHIEKLIGHHGPAGGRGRRGAIPVSAVRQFRAEGERPLKVPSPRPPPLFSPESAGARARQDLGRPTAFL